jgi:hypothetical protein
MRYLRSEAAYRATVWLELPAYGVANAASELLLWVLGQTGIPPLEEGAKPSASFWRAKALMYLGVIGVRTTRSAMAVIACGYEAETMGFKRTLMEVHSRAQLVVKDQSGGYAEQWLKGRAGKPAKAVGAFAPEDFFAMLSHSSHADHRGVENFLAISQPDGSTTFVIAPERRVEVSNSTLMVFASETRDIANVIAVERGLEIPQPQLAELDAAIAAHPFWSQEDDEAVPEDASVENGAS